MYVDVPVSDVCLVYVCLYSSCSLVLVLLLLKVELVQSS